MIRKRRKRGAWAGRRAAGTVGAGLGVLALAGSAAGQNQWLIQLEYSDPAVVINSLDDTVTVTLWAGFEPKYFAFAKGALDITADDPVDRGSWGNPQVLLTGPGAWHGVIADETVEGIVAIQLSLGQIYPDTANPIAAWRGTWSTVDLHPRKISLRTFSSEFVVYTEPEVSKSFLNWLEEGQGSIQVVPAPAAAMVGLVAIAASVRPPRRD